MGKSVLEMARGMYAGEAKTIEVRHGDAVVDFEVPAGWSASAAKICFSRYARKAGVPSHVKPAGGVSGSSDVGGWTAADDCEFGMETSAIQIAWRLSGCWAHWLVKLGYMSTAAAIELRDAAFDDILSQRAAPNSPQWFNTGLHWGYGITGGEDGHFYADHESGEVRRSESGYERPQPSACFIQPIRDDLVGDGGIVDLVVREARLFKHGSGTGTNFSNIRGKGEPLSGGGTSSGLMSFLRIGDRAAGAIKSGGTTRRAAKMVTLDVDHPDIEAYIGWKAREETKVAALATGSAVLRRHVRRIEAATDAPRSVHDGWNLTPSKNHQLNAALLDAIEDGVPESLLKRIVALLAEGRSVEIEQLDCDWQGEGYSTVSGQNANNSVRLPNTFMEAVSHDADWYLTNRTDGSVAKTVRARDLWDQINQSAWESADPGVQFDDIINDWHTCPNSGRINASNPCSEFLFLDNTACTLASINLVKFYSPSLGDFGVKGFLNTVRRWTYILEVSVAMGQYPSAEVAEMSWRTRPIGLGYANLGGMLMRMGVRYGSRRAQEWCGQITALMTGHVYKTSAEIAADMGAFPDFEKNREAMMRVIRKHRDAAVGLIGTFSEDAEEVWSHALALGELHGFRNAQATVIAPTGTIGLVMDCDTTGIEPDYALVKDKQLDGGGWLKIVNQSVPHGLRALGYREDQVVEIVEYVEQNGTIEGAPHILNETRLAVFDCANTCGSGTRSLSAADHVNMLAAATPFVSGGISKTVNLPSDATIADIEAVHLMAYKLGVKCIAVYRDGSKLSQPLNSAGGESWIVPRESGDDWPNETIAPADLVRMAQEARASAPAADVDGERLFGDRRTLPQRRVGYTQKVRVGGHKMYLRTGEYDDGDLGELFVDMHKEGAAFRSLMNAFAKSVSIGLQYGVPLGQFVDAFVFTRFEPAGMVTGHDRIKSATSIIDLIFRDLAINYLGRDDLAHVTPERDVAGTEIAQPDVVAERVTEEAPAKSPRAPKVDARAMGYTGSSCSNCGSMRMTRSGTCEKCLECGTTTGCS